MFDPIFCMYKIETLFDQVSSICGLPNKLGEIHAKPTLNHWTNWEMVAYFVRVPFGLCSTKISQGANLV